MQRNELFRPTVSPRVRLALLGAIVLACSLPLLALSVHAQQAPEYLSPRPGAVLVSPGTTIAVRYGPTLNAASVGDGLFQVEGSQSGRHTGRVILSDDHRTVIFRPYLPFAPAEKVSVNLSAGLRSTAAESLGAVALEFHISPQAPSQKQIPIAHAVRRDGYGVVREICGQRQKVRDDLVGGGRLGLGRCCIGLCR